MLNEVNESCRSICLLWQLLIDKLKTSAKIQSQIAFVALSASVIKLHLVDHLTSSLQSGGSRGKKTVYIKEGKKPAFGLYFACHIRLDSMTHKVGGVAHCEVLGKGHL